MSRTGSPSCWWRSPALTQASSGKQLPWGAGQGSTGQPHQTNKPVDLGTTSSRGDWASGGDDDADAGGSLVLDEVYSLMKCR